MSTTHTVSCLVVMIGWPFCCLDLPNWLSDLQGVRLTLADFVLMLAEVVRGMKRHVVATTRHDERLK